MPHSKYLSLLRKLPITECILNNDRRVQVFRGEDAYQMLKQNLLAQQPADSFNLSDKLSNKNNEQKKIKPSDDQSSIKSNSLQNNMQNSAQTDHAIQIILNDLINSEQIVRCTVNKKNVTLNLSKTFNKKDSYILVEEEHSFLQLIISIVLILLILSLVLFQIWPNQIKSKVSLIIYPIILFFIFIGLLGVIRLIIFSITYFTHQPGIWLFPNLFADVGFIDSFLPVWCWHGEDVRHTKKDE
ncbi:Membrane component of ER protein translocation complex [Pseudoloma neurophilia]|uniref:Translocation protein SEC62 n=1 Tax=Pseudoloma neurophilia TaxID=146866 RepID=A0A0R0M0W2_9MICR|nr:Membrane component of ER protein translocation complex [Pseudoloma neurophilia]